MHVSSLDFQPIAAEDVALLLTRFAISEPANDTLKIAGPTRGPMNEFVEAFIKTTGDNKTVVPNDKREYFGNQVPQTTLVPEGNAYLGNKTFEQFLQSLGNKA